MSTRSRKRKDSGDSVGSAVSEPAITRSRSTTPFTLRSQCTRHGSECPEGHGISFKNRLSPSPRSSKKSHRKIVIEKNGNIRKNLALNLEEQYQLGQHESSKTFINLVTEKSNKHTSDYSSAEEEGTRETSSLETSVTPTILFSTPLHSSLKTNSITPLKRSAEKTDFTYANSYSYRTEVTPERVICMPNMTRRSIERVHGFGFSSPELRFGQLGKTSDLNISYKNGHESDDGIDETYQLKPSPRSYSSAAYFFSSVAYLKLKGIMFSLAWWIYLITCYSLLLDTCVLQSRGITKLRHFCRQQTKSNRNLLMLFLFLPLCFCAGGLLYSALHAFNIRAEENPSNTLVNPSPPQDLLQTLNSLSDSPSPMLTESSISIGNPITDIPTEALTAVTLSQSDDSSWQDLKNELKLTKEALSALKEKVNAYDGKMSSLASQVELFQGQLMSVSTANMKDCCDQAAPDMLERLVEAKLAALIASLSQQTGLNVDNVANTVSLYNRALAELKELKEWKRSEENKIDLWNNSISNIQNRLKETELSILTQIGDGIGKAIKRWEADSKPALIEKMKEELFAEIRSQIKLINANSGRGLNKDEVEQLIHSALGVYDSDKTGLADFALEPAGGVVLSTRCTETYNSHRPRLSIWGFSLWNEPNNPRVVIQPGIVPGQCWSFRGFDGYLVIQLSRKIVPTAFTLEHIPRSLAPDGQIDSAPRNFTVYGLSREVDIAGIILGQYTFDNLGVPLQSFPVQASNPGAFSIVELRIHSNYGNLNYTCLYRFRVHGHVA